MDRLAAGTLIGINESDLPIDRQHLFEAHAVNSRDGAGRGRPHDPHAGARPSCIPLRASSDL